MTSSRMQQVTGKQRKETSEAAPSVHDAAGQDYGDHRIAIGACWSGGFLQDQAHHLHKLWLLLILASDS